MDRVNEEEVMDYRRRANGSRAMGAIIALVVLGVAALGATAGAGRAAAFETHVATPVAMPATVSVNGQGTVDVEPDTASVQVGVDVIEGTLDAAQANATAQATAIIDAVKAAGIADDDIQTTNFSVFIMRNYDNEGNPAEIQGYQISNQVNVTIRDIEAVGDILDAVVDAGANNIYGITFYVDDPTSAASQARRQAVENARTKAEELADAAGMTLGRVVSISESFAPVPPSIAFDGAEDMAMAGRASAPIERGTTEVMVEVQMSFELE
jgi:uncharacterized protein YggE